MSITTAVGATTTAQSPEWRVTGAAQMPIAPRATPQTTIEALMYSVRERGLKALGEAANQERLGRCDAAGRTQINQRIETLIAAGARAVEVQSNG
jgi:hypothetical protein